MPPALPWSASVLRPNGIDAMSNWRGVERHHMRRRASITAFFLRRHAVSIHPSLDRTIVARKSREARARSAEDRSALKGINETAREGVWQERCHHQKRGAIISVIGWLPTTRVIAH